MHCKATSGWPFFMEMQPQLAASMLRMHMKFR